MKQWLLVVMTVISFAASGNPLTLRVFTWDGYVAPKDVETVNQLLRQSGSAVTVEVISPFAESQEQMFEVLRAGKADICFLTVNYLKMQKAQIARLLKPINVRHLNNYKSVLPELSQLDMGRDEHQRLLYVPFAGGAYGIWVNRKVVSVEDTPRKLNDLLLPQWKGKLSLTNAQIQANVALAFMAVGRAPFELDDLIKEDKRDAALQLASAQSEPQLFLNALYQQVGKFWTTAPTFESPLVLVSSYGPEIAGLKQRGENWQLIVFSEGQTVWLDTMNIVNGINEEKEAAAYVFIDHMLSSSVQQRVIQQLSLIAVTQNVSNPMLDSHPDFFRNGNFWPPYQTISDNLMAAMSKRAMATRQATSKPPSLRR